MVLRDRGVVDDLDARRRRAPRGCRPRSRCAPRRARGRASAAAATARPRSGRPATSCPRRLRPAGAGPRSGPGRTRRACRRRSSGSVTRSSSGFRSSRASHRTRGVELEPGQLAVDVREAGASRSGVARPRPVPPAPAARAAARAVRPLTGRSADPLAPGDALIGVAFACLAATGADSARAGQDSTLPWAIRPARPGSGLRHVAPFAGQAIDEHAHRDPARRIDEGLVGPLEAGVERARRLAAARPDAIRTSAPRPRSGSGCARSRGRPGRRPR